MNLGCMTQPLDIRICSQTPSPRPPEHNTIQVNCDKFLSFRDRWLGTFFRWLYYCSIAISNSPRLHLFSLIFFVFRAPQLAYHSKLLCPISVNRSDRPLPFHEGDFLRRLAFSRRKMISNLLQVTLLACESGSDVAERIRIWFAEQSLSEKYHILLAAIKIGDQ